MYDILIIGAGIIGSFLAHDLSKYNCKVVLLEKESDVANKATMANSAIVHAGHDPEDGTLMAKLNVLGNRMYPTICKELGVSFKQTSAFVVATSKTEEETLALLYNRAISREIPVHYLTGEEAKQKEANLSDFVRKVIELPTTGVIYPWEVAIALAEEAVENGVELFLNEEVIQIKKQEDIFFVKTKTTEYQSKIIINAAGVYADQIYKMISDKAAFKIIPRKGEYFVLDKLAKPFVERVIYPVPSKRGKGVLVVPTTHGNILLGPDSNFVDDKEENSNHKTSLDYVRQELKKTVKDVPMQKVIRIFAGLRPTGDTHDFVIEEASDIKNFINVACIESPGLASAPAISQYVLTDILAINKKFFLKNSYKKRRPYLNLKQMKQEERDALVKQNPAFGRIICRCEQITEGEIIDAIHRPVGAVTVKGLKKRVRPGMGRCQGGFCEPLVIEILAREKQVSPIDIRLDGIHSTMLIDTTKNKGDVK